VEIGNYTLRRPKRAKNEAVAPKEEETQTAENKKSVQLSPYRSQKLPHEGEKNLIICTSLVMGSNAMTSLSLATVL
jgi:hypothetical protein